jgi:prepilin-type N-terminal cleavage/methylation domain-containing protein
MKAHTTQSKSRGFTLVELLVVIVIILALASLAIVAVGIGKRAGNAAKCSKNMKEIFSSLSAITAEGVNTGLHAPNTFPPYKGTLQDGQEASFVWWDLVAEKMDVANRDSGRYRWQGAFSDTMLQNPLSEKTLGGNKTEWDSLHNDPDQSHGGYAYNANLGGDVSADAQEENVYKVRLSKIEDAPNTIYFAEADDKQETAGWVFKNMANAPQGNYKESVHCCMVDGHVELIENQLLKQQSTYDFYTEIEDKNYGSQP